MSDLNKLADALEDKPDSDGHCHEAAAILRAAAGADVQGLMARVEAYSAWSATETTGAEDEAEKARIALESALRLALPVWRPIAEAPKDGTHVLLLFPEWGPLRGRWDLNRYAKTPRPYWTCDIETLYGISRVRTNQPTHYMPLPPQPACTCAACMPQGTPLEGMRMILCPICGNKRCPHAADHRNECTNSNAPGQAGSSYPPQPKGQP